MDPPFQIAVLVILHIDLVGLKVLVHSAVREVPLVLDGRVLRRYRVDANSEGAL